MRVRAVALYCGENPEMDDGQKAAAEALGATLAKSGIKIIYGGDQRGLMGIVANAALAAGGEVVGIALKKFAHNAHPGLTELYFVDRLSERKDLMRDLSDASITMPGMDGTLDEYYGDRTEMKAAKKAVSEDLKLNKQPSEYDLKLSNRLVVVFDPNGYFLPQKVQAKKAGRIKKNTADLDRFVVGETIAEVFNALKLSDAPVLKENEYLNMPVLNGNGIRGAFRTRRHYHKNGRGLSDNIKEVFQAGQLQMAALFLPLYAIIAATTNSSLSRGQITPDQIPADLGVAGIVVLLNFAFAAQAATGRYLFAPKTSPDQPSPYRDLISGSKGSEQPVKPPVKQALGSQAIHYT